MDSGVGNAGAASAQRHASQRRGKERSMNACTTWYTPGDPAHRTVSEWRAAAVVRRGSGVVAVGRWQTAARRYARVHGESKALRADGRVVRFWLEGGVVRQRTYHKVVMARRSGA